MRIFLCSILALGLVATSYQAQAQEKKDDKKGDKKLPVPAIPPTHANVSYGKHERNVLDFWQAKSDKPTPVVICIHGGGWVNGDKSGYYGRVKTFLDAGISVVTINYRLMKQANEEKVVPPV
jgi:acetyl esterase/lipase